MFPGVGSLERRGFVKAKKSKAAGTEPGSRRNKNLIEITPAGEAALLDFAKRNKERFEKITFFFSKVIEDAS